MICINLVIIAVVYLIYKYSDFIQISDSTSIWLHFLSDSEFSLKSYFVDLEPELRTVSVREALLGHGWAFLICHTLTLNIDLYQSKIHIEKITEYVALKQESVSIVKYQVSVVNNYFLTMVKTRLSNLP